MKWRPWRQRAESAKAGAEATHRQLERLQAQRPQVEQLADAVVRETIQMNGWTERAKRAFS